MTEDFEYNIDDLTKFYFQLSMIGGSADDQQDIEMLKALKIVSDLLPSRLPPNMNMQDLIFMGMPQEVKEEFETLRKNGKLKWTDFALERRAPEEAH